MHRRTFLTLTMGLLTGRLWGRPKNLWDLSPQQARHLSEEDFWEWVRFQFPRHPTILNLNNGGVSPHPRPVQEALWRLESAANELPAYIMWRVQDRKEPLRQRLAQLAGADPEEIAIVRNSTEALETVIFGLDLRRGDEVIAAESDYPSMVAAWKQREERDGIKVRWIRLPIPTDDEEALTRAYLDAITPRTRVIHITHLINWTGQVVPPTRICIEARRKGIFTIVDAAHSFAHLVYRFSDLGCDAIGVSLHKWLCAPFGTGLLYVRKEKIREVWPLYAAPPDRKADDIRKFEHLGTRSIPTEQAILAAIDFHEAIGAQRKYDRLTALRRHWLQKALQIPGIQSLTPDALAGGLATIQMEGWDPSKLADHLLEKYQIFTTAIDWMGIKGLRITPHVYTRFSELDRLVEALWNIRRG